MYIGLGFACNLVREFQPDSMFVVILSWCQFILAFFLEGRVGDFFLVRQAQWLFAMKFQNRTHFPVVLDRMAERVEGHSPVFGR